MRGRVLALALIAIGVALVLSLDDSEANHPDPDGAFGYAYTHDDLYPSCDWPGWGLCRDHDIRYRVCISYGDEAGYAIWDWTHRFGFNQQSTLTATREYNCGVGSDLLFWITDNATVTNRCGGARACYLWTGITWDNLTQRWEVTAADITVSSSLLSEWSGNQGVRIHIFEHEVGHGFGMEHHLTNCTVMSGVSVNGQTCGYWVTDSDIGTARCVYIYAC